jgi:hypothetical protein
MQFIKYTQLTRDLHKEIQDAYIHVRQHVDPEVSEVFLLAYPGTLMLPQVRFLVLRGADLVPCPTRNLPNLSRL